MITLLNAIPTVKRIENRINVRKVLFIMVSDFVNSIYLSNFSDVNINNKKIIFNSTSPYMTDFFDFIR